MPLRFLRKRRAPPASPASPASARWSIRPMTSSDFEALVEYDWTPIVGERDTVYLFLVRDHAELCRVAEAEDGLAVGYLIAARSADGSSAFVFHVHVRAGWRRRGIGSALVREFEEAAGAAGVTRAWFLVAADVRAFYESHGYARADEVLWPEAVDYVQRRKGAVVMAKDLRDLPSPGR